MKLNFYYLWFNSSLINFNIFRTIAVIFAAISVALAVEITTPTPSVACTEQNCIVSFTKMDDEKLSEMIDSVSAETSEILALKLQSCDLVSIPTNVFNMFPSLLCLMVTTPGLTSIGKNVFHNASNLQFLYLPGNRISKLGFDSFKGASNMNEINLSDNEIKVVSESAFEGLDHLESLSLSGNQIAFFGQETFSPLADLMNLDLSNNILKFLDARLFANNKQLNGVNVANNKIIALTSWFIRVVPQIKVLNMMNNPCTKDTILENIPFIKITDSTNIDKEDEDSLKNCYKYYLFMTNPETSDRNDLLEQAEVVREDIEQRIIIELTDSLHAKDSEISDLKSKGQISVIIAAAVLICFCLYNIILAIPQVVEDTHSKPVESKTQTKDKENATIDSKQVVYTIEV